MSANGDINPWVRADLDTFNPETLELVPEHLREDYTRLMKQLYHAREVANLVLENLHIWEEERRSFFEYVTQFDSTGFPPNVTEFAKDQVNHEAAKQELTNVTSLEDYRKNRESYYG